MAFDARSETFPGVWAKNASTNVTNPVVGQPYRDPNVSTGTVERGQPFNEAVLSEIWNQMFYLFSSFGMDFEKLGFSRWSPLTNYPVGGWCMGTDEIPYRALRASGPANGGAQNPVSSTGYWQTIKDYAGSSNAVPTTRRINTTAPLTGGGDLSADRTLAIASATANAVGAVSLATSAEVITGTNNTKAVTPAGLTARTATTTRTGIVALATAAEVAAGTNASKAVTPASLSASRVVSVLSSLRGIGSTNVTVPFSCNRIHVTGYANIPLCGLNTRQVVTLTVAGSTLTRIREGERTGGAGFGYNSLFSLSLENVVSGTFAAGQSVAVAIAATTAGGERPPSPVVDDARVTLTFFSA